MHHLVLGAFAAAALTASALATPAKADVLVPDPLHGFCNGTGVGTCSDNGTNTPLGNSTTFGFTASAASSSGTSVTLSLDILLPAPLLSPPSSFLLTGVTGPTATANLVSSTTPWKSGDLASYLGIAASPNNPIGAYLPITQRFDPTATGFYVYQTAGLSTTLYPPSMPGKPSWDVPSGLALGSYIVGFFSNATLCGKKGMCATANSGALIENDNSTIPVPEPGSLALLGTALLGLGIFVRRRRG